jgi:hypothetical protein
MRIATLLIFGGLSSTLGTLCVLGVWRPVPNWSSQGRQLLLEGTREGAAKSIASFAKALDAEPASPYSWADLGEAYDEAGATATADRLFERARELGPSNPPVLLRAGFHWLKGDQRMRALRCTSRVLEISDQYDDSVFALYQRFDLPRAEVLAAGLGESSRTWRAYLKWLIARDQLAAAKEVWSILGTKAARDNETTTSYLDYLVGKKQYVQVPLIWEQFVGNRARGYGRGATLFNGSFESIPTQSPVDWRMETESQGVSTAREQGCAKEGEWSLVVRFSGKANVTWTGARQLVVVEAGRYLLRAWVKSEYITTDRGPQFQVQDADSPSRLTARTEPFRGTHDWKPVELPFQVGPGTGAIMVSLVREPSQKFDSKVAGTIWVDGVEIVNEGTSSARVR